MVYIDNIISKSILAGIVIGFGAFIYLSSNNPLVGSLLFSVGLCSVCLYKLNLFTGKSGYLQDKYDLRRLILVLIFNIVSAYLFGYIVSILNSDLVSTANIFVSNRLDVPVYSYIIRSLITGFLMSLAIESEKNDSNHLILFLSVLAFVYTGCYHCVAESFYYGVSSLTTDNLLSLIFRLLITIIFNFIGCTLYNIVISKSIYNISK